MLQAGEPEPPAARENPSSTSRRAGRTEAEAREAGTDRHAAPALQPATARTRAAMPNGNGPRGGVAHGTGMADSHFPERRNTLWFPTRGRGANARPPTSTLWAETARQPATSWPVLNSSPRSLNGGPLAGPSGYTGLHTVQRHTARQVVAVARPMGRVEVTHSPRAPRARRVMTEEELVAWRAQRDAEDEAIAREFRTTSSGAFPGWLEYATPVSGRHAKLRDSVIDFREMSLMSTGRIVNAGGKRLVPGRNS